MVEPADAERGTGSSWAASPRSGSGRKLTTVLDVTAERFETIYVSAGKRGVGIDLRPDDLVAACGAIVAGIAGGTDRQRDSPAPRAAETSLSDTPGDTACW